MNVLSLTAHAPTAEQSSTSRGFVPQSSGDPNYYASSPAFDVRGFWHAAGTNPPAFPPMGQPKTPSGGTWVAQGSATRNGQKTTRWIYYPPEGALLTSGKVGSADYTFSRSNMTGGSLLFLKPDYWVKKGTVPPKPSSSYHPQPTEYVPPDNIVPVVGTFYCSKWALVATDKGSTVYTGIVGSMFVPRDVFRFYTKYIGYSPYFTYRGYLFKFEFTGKESVIKLCTDGLSVQRNPDGSATKFTAYPPGGSGGALVVRTKGMGMDPIFNAALLRSREPQGLGQFVAGSQGVPVMKAIPTSSVPAVASSDWVEFYPSDPQGFQTNTNLGGSSSEASDPNLDAILAQVSSTAPGATVYWLLSDPNSGAAWTVSRLTNSSLARSVGAVAFNSSNIPGATALLRSSWSGSKLKLEIALRTIPDGVSLPSATSPSSSACTNWLEVVGPTGGNVAAATGIKVALPSKLQSQILSAYAKYSTQPQFIAGIPGPGGSWKGFEPVPVPDSPPPFQEFMYGGQLYRVGWMGVWTPGQGFGDPMSGPSISLCPDYVPPPASAKAPPPLPSLPSGLTYTMPTKVALAPGAQPIVQPVDLLPSAGQPASPPPSAVTPPPVASASLAPSASSIPTAAIVVGTIVGGIVLGGIAYLLTE